MAPPPSREAKTRLSFTRWLNGRSIATRLFLSATVWSTVILLAAGIILFAIYRRTSEQDFDARLGVYARTLIAEIASSGPDDQRADLGQMGEPLFDLPLSGWYWQVTRLDNPAQEVHASSSLFAERLPRLGSDGDASTGGVRKGYATGPDDRRLRIVERLIDAGEQGRYLVQVAASPEDIEADVIRFEIAVGLTFSILALALIGSTALQVRFGLRPLRRLQDGVAAIRRGERERIDGSFPRDLAPFASELNLLMISNKEIVERSRTHVGNLAHALKTPLSVIVNEAEACTAQSGSDLLPQKVREQAAIMSDQVRYYLDRARAAARSTVVGTTTDVRPVLDSLVRTFQKIYQDRPIAFETESEVGLRFRGERQDLEELVGNLVDNAGKWANRRIAVQATAAVPADPSAGICIIVDDDGPGLGPHEREQAVHRGRRMDETKPGSGLGLSIVVDLAGVYGGALVLDQSPLGGLRACLRLP